MRGWQGAGLQATWPGAALTPARPMGATARRGCACQVTGALALQRSGAAGPSRPPTAAPVVGSGRAWARSVPFGGFLSSSDFSLSQKLCPNEKLARERTGWDSGPSLVAVLPGAISSPEWWAGAVSRGLPFTRLFPAASYLILPPHVSWQEAPCPEGSTGLAHLDPWHRHLLVSGGEGGHTPRVGVGEPAAGPSWGAGWGQHRPPGATAGAAHP